MRVKVDHIVMAVPDLKKAAQRVQHIVGIGSVPGGRHEGAGTSNAIVPLGRSYLELVTVVDEGAAATNPFGRLISAALAQERSPLTAWAGALHRNESLRGYPSISRQVLRRDGFEVELYGADEAVERPDLPLLIRRSPCQINPADTGTNHGQGSHHVLSVSVSMPKRQTRWPKVESGPTALSSIHGVRESQEHFVGFTIIGSDGMPFKFTKQSWHTA